MLESKTSDYLNPWLQDAKEYKAGKTFEYVMEKYGIAREKILRLAGNESTIGTSPKAIKAAQNACPNSNFYDEPKAESLITALETYHQLNTERFGVVVGNGMDSIIEHVLMLFCNKDSSIIDLSPTFIYYKFAADRLGIEVIDCPRKLEANALTICADSILQAIKTNTKVIFLCTPNNPDGGVIELSAIERITKAAQEKNIIVFVDHAYIDFTDRERYEAKNLLAKYDNLILGYTFSKAFAMAGFRVGYGIMHKELQKKFLSLSTPFLNSKVSIAAAKEALNDEKHLEKIIGNNQQERPKLKAELEKLGLVCFESQANFILFYHPNKKSQEIFEALLAEGIIIRAVQGLSVSGSSLEALRVTIGKPEENKRFITALKKIIT